MHINAENVVLNEWLLCDRSLHFNTPEKESLQFYYLKEIYHIFIPSLFLAFAINPSVFFQKVELSLVPFEDSSKTLIVHRGSFKANIKFNTKERWVAKKGRSRLEVCHQYKNGKREKYHKSLLILWLKSPLGVCYKCDGYLVGKDSLSEQPSPQCNKCGELTAKQVLFLVIEYFSAFVDISACNACTCTSSAQSCYEILSLLYI